MDRNITVARWLAVIGIVAWLLMAWNARAQTPEQLRLQETRWSAAKIRPEWQARINAALAQYQRTKGRYDRVTAMRVNGVPSLIIFTLHGRESTWSFAHHLHEGSPLTNRTRYIPKGRPIGNPPFTWEESAEDVLYKLKDLENRVDWTNLPRTLQAIEAYNGLGYQRYHRETPSPYLWSGTTIYSRGKYVADGRWDKLAVDKQIGCAAILKAANWK